MDTSQIYTSPVAYSLLQTPFAAVFDAPDGSSSNPNWQTVVSDLVKEGVEPIFNNISDETCAKAWMYLVPKLGFLPNVLSVKITLSAGISSKEDLSTVFSTSKNWLDQASFRAALGAFLGIHNTQLIPLAMVIVQQESTQKLIQIFSNPETAMTYIESLT